jgi:2'-5' RNA ligase
MPRLFTGIELPDDIVWRLSMICSGLPGAHWIDQDNFHITLRFVGDIGESVADNFAQALDAVRFDSFNLELQGLGSFGGNKPRAIWAALKPSPQLEALQRAHERAARRAGLPPETRNFIPHITLARLKNTKPHAVAEFLSRQSGFFSLPFTVRRFVLFSSRPNVGGGPYRMEAWYDARDAAFSDEAAA